MSNFRVCSVVALCATVLTIPVLGDARTESRPRRNAVETITFVAPFDEPVLEVEIAEAESARWWGEWDAAREAERVEAERVAAIEAARVAAIERARAPVVSAAPVPAPRAPVVWDGSLHSHPFLVCTRRWESDRGDANGNGLHDAGYEAYNGDGPYLGAYQFLQSTWNGVAARAGRGDLVGVDPRWASWQDQDALAWALYQEAGNRPWGGRC